MHMPSSEAKKEENLLGIHSDEDEDGAARKNSPQFDTSSDSLSSPQTETLIPHSFVPSYNRSVSDQASALSPTGEKRVKNGHSRSPEPYSSISSSSSEPEADNESHKESSEVDALLRIPILDSSIDAGTITTIQSEMPPLEDTKLTVTAEGSFKWTIPNFLSFLKHKELRSPVFQVNDSYWKLLLYPRSPPPMSHSNTSLYLMRVLPSEMVKETRKTLCVQFSLAVLLPSTSEVMLERVNEHRFMGVPLTAQEPKDSEFVDCQDWGYLSFIPTARLLRACLSVSSNENPLEIVVRIRLIHDPIGNLWVDPATFDSRRECGYVGLRNQGATCYMNSLLQPLFMITAFRKITFQIPIPSADDSKAASSSSILSPVAPITSIPLALQRLFYALQTHSGPVSTNELTRSFGWKSIESIDQQDIQEFCRLLLDALERKMKGTPMEKALDKIFRGETLRYVQCINVPFESTGKEPFYDISVPVKGMASLTESLAAFVTPEILTGDNKYDAEGWGHQDARIGILFSSLPPVLHIQLKRFEYDFERDLAVKINDRFEFAETLDMAPYLKDTSGISTMYRLHAVLVHSGEVGGGHYYAFIRNPSATTKENPWGTWLRFNDENVYPVAASEAIEDNFGGSISKFMGSQKLQPNAIIKRFTSAYMLVYIQEARWDEIVGENFSDAEFFSEQILRDNYQDESLMEGGEEENPEELSSIWLITDAILRESITPSIFPRLEGVINREKYTTVVQKPSSTLLREFAQELEENYGVMVNSQHFYSIVDEETMRVFPVPSLDITFKELSGFPLLLTMDADMKEMTEEDDGSLKLLIFIKKFDGESGTLSFQSSLVVLRPEEKTFQELLSDIITTDDNYNAAKKEDDWVLFNELTHDFVPSTDATIGLKFGTTVYFIMISSRDLNRWKEMTSRIRLSVISGDVEKLLGKTIAEHERLQFTFSADIKEILVEALFNQCPKHLYSLCSKNDIKKIEVKTSRDTWVSLESPTIQDMLKEAGWNVFSVFLNKHNIRIRVFSLNFTSLSVLVYCPSSKDFLRSPLTGKSLEETLNDIQALQSKCLKIIDGDVKHPMNSLLDYLSTSPHSAKRILEVVNGSIARIYMPSDPIEGVVGSRSLLLAIEVDYFADPLILLRVVHVRRQPEGISSEDRRDFFGIPYLVPAIEGEPWDETLRRFSKLIPGVIGFDVTAGRGSLKIFHISPLGGSQGMKFIGSATVTPSTTLWEYVSSSAFDASLDFIALEHPERAPLPIRSISYIGDSHSAAYATDSPPYGLRMRSGNAMRID